MISPEPTRLVRELGFFGAVMLGLGSIVGTGVFVSIGIAAGVTGSLVVFAVMLGALVAAFNGLSSAQLAASNAVAGGTYEYGYAFLTPSLGFVAGWMFLLAKSASAATAALGFSGYLIHALGLSPRFLIPLALFAVAALTLTVLSGLRRSNLTNIVIVSVTLGALALFVFSGLPTRFDAAQIFTFEDARGVRAFFHAAALMFVAYTGYGRIATLGEEVKNPRETIPRAIITTLLVTMLLYLAVTFVAVGSVGAQALSAATAGAAAPLEVVARSFALPLVPELVALGAMSAMLGVLLNLILGLSRVLLAMGRRGDMPTILGKLGAAGTPRAAIIVMGLFIALLVLVGDVRATWSFSAFTVLVYYAITNLAALYIPASGRLFPRWVSVCGLLACLSLAFFVELPVLLLGLGMIGLGLLWHRFVSFG